MINAINLKEWVICGACGCKLAGINPNSMAKLVYIKCHSCKNINLIQVGDENGNKE